MPQHAINSKDQEPNFQQIPIRKSQDPSVSVFDDDAKDILTGSSGTDWFFANLEGEGTLDKITDLDNDAFTEDLEFILNE